MFNIICPDKVHIICPDKVHSFIHYRCLNILIFFFKQTISLPLYFCDQYEICVNIFFIYFEQLIHLYFQEVFAIVNALKWMFTIDI